MFLSWAGLSYAWDYISFYLEREYCVDRGRLDSPGILGSLVVAGMAYLLYYIMLRLEYFAHTHYPIRFNRVTQMVHVFRHDGPDGALTVPWESVFFHIGRGTNMKFLRDIRGEVWTAIR